VELEEECRLARFLGKSKAGELGLMGWRGDRRRRGVMEEW
jgi:hypothetical protein